MKPSKRIEEIWNRGDLTMTQAIAQYLDEQWVEEHPDCQNCKDMETAECCDCKRVFKCIPEKEENGKTLFKEICENLDKNLITQLGYISKQKVLQLIEEFWRDATAADWSSSRALQEKIKSL